MVFNTEVVKIGKNKIVIPFLYNRCGNGNIFTATMVEKVNSRNWCSLFLTTVVVRIGKMKIEVPSFTKAVVKK